MPPPSVCTALPVFEPDSDGVIQRFAEQVPAAAAENTAEPELYLTLPAALTTGKCGFQRDGEGAGAPEKIRYATAANIRRYTAGTVIDAARDPYSDYSQNLGLTHSIVIVGGAFRYSRDEYTTPIGVLYGEDIIAHAISGPPIKEVGLLRVLCVEFMVEVLLLGLVSWANLLLPWALLLSSVLSIVAAFLISWGLFNYAGYFYSVFGSMAGVVLAYSLKWCGIRCLRIGDIGTDDLSTLQVEIMKWIPNFRRTAAVVVFIVIVMGTALAQGKKRALVIGIYDYDTLSKLSHAASDAADAAVHLNT